MRDLTALDPSRVRTLQLGEDGGAFVVLSPVDRAPMHVIASFGAGWDHVSVSRKSRCPNWTEMEHVARLFFADDEAAMQLHVPAADHVNMHATTLHWWRPQAGEIPRPPSVLVGLGATPIKDIADADARMRAAGIAP